MIAYKITNKLTNKAYVGITTQALEKRWKQHCGNSNKSKLIHNAIQKYGVENFTIEQIASAIGSIQNLKLVEIELIKQLNTKKPYGYNLTDGGDGTFGLKQSEETKKKRSLKLKGQKPSDETKAKLSQSHLGNFGNLKGIIIATNIKTGEQITLDGLKDIESKGFSQTCVYRCVNGERKTHKSHTFLRN